MPLEITSPQNPRVKAAVRLRDARARIRAGRFIVDGAREIARAVAAGVRLDEAFVCQERLDDPVAQAVVDSLAASGCEVFSVPPAIYARIAFGNRLDGVVAIGKTPARTLDSIPITSESVVAVLVGIEKPGNVGAILRSADGAGITAVVVADGRTDLFNPNCIRASLGIVFSLPTAVADSAATLDWLARRGLSVFAARPDAKLDYTQAALGRGAAIVLGSEATGLSTQWQTAAVTPIALPMLGRADSLNVSVTAGILFYESLRQRNSG